MHAHDRKEIVEDIIDPQRPIIDPHHHLRDRAGDRYVFDQLRHDLDSGHNIVATVVVECGDMHRGFGPPEMRPVGETEFNAGIAAMYDSGKYGRRAAAAGIVSFADLRLGAAVQPVLDAHRRASGGRLRGVRNPVAWHDDPELRKTRVGPPGQLHEPAFREGVATLGRNGLSWDVWIYHPQLLDLVDLARACPDTVIVLNHLGGPLGAGPYRGMRDAVFAEWLSAMRKVAACPNVVCKVGGLGMPIIGLGFDEAAQRPTSEVLATAYRPYVDPVIDLFGVQRCMFESNFPPDGLSSSYAVLWNALKRVTRDFSETEKTALFCGTAADVYRLHDALNR